MATARSSFSQVETYLQTFPVGQEVQEVELGEEENEPAAHICRSPSYLAVTGLAPQDTPDSPHTWCDCSVVGEGVRV